MKKQNWTIKKTGRVNRPFENGISLPELAATIVIIGVLATITAPSISFGRDALKDSGQRVEGLMKLARSRSMAQTSAFKISPKSSNELKLEYSNTCNAATWKDASGLVDTDLKLDKDVIFSAASENGVVVADPSSDWSVCFNSRGGADKTMKLTILDSKKNESQQLEIFRGGTITVL